MLAAVGQAQAQPMKALASADSSRYLVGDWIRVTVELRHPRGTTFQPSIPDSLGGFAVLAAAAVCADVGHGDPHGRRHRTV